MSRIYAVAMIAVCALGLLVSGVAPAQSTQSNWADEISNSINFYKTNYPGSNWDPYVEKMAHVREALSRDDQRTVKVEMGKWFKMLRARAHGLSDVAADELFNFSLMVTPIQEYGIAVPPPAGGVSDLPN